MSEYLNVIFTTIGGTTLAISALSIVLGKIWINRVLTQERATFSRALEGDKSIYSKELEIEKASYSKELESDRATYSKELESEKAEYVKEIENIKNALLQETESHKIKLKKSEFIFEKQFEAATELNILVNEIQPNSNHPDMEYCDYLEIVAGNCSKIQNLIRVFLLKNNTALDSEVSTLLERAIILAERGRVHNPNEQQLNLFSDRQLEDAKSILNNVWKAYELTLKSIKSQVTN